MDGLLDTIREFFDRRIAGARGVDDGSAVRLATAALLAEVMRLDGEVEPAERDAAHRAVREKFGLAADDAQTLIALAEQAAREATGYYPFTSLINRHFDHDRKRRIVTMLWSVAYADGDVDPHESHQIRRIAELLYLTPKETVLAKLEARDAQGIADDGGSDA